MDKRKIKVSKTARYFTQGGELEKIRTVLFVLHGYAQLADEFLKSFTPIFRDDLLIVAPEGLHRFYARGAGEKVVASWMTKEDREDDIEDYVDFLDEVYLEVIKAVQQKVEIKVLGFSQGAATASRWAAARNSKIDELVLWCGLFPPNVEVKNLPSNLKLTIVTASDDKFISAEEEQKQIELIKTIVPDLNHFQFEGNHEINEKALIKFMSGT